MNWHKNLTAKRSANDPNAIVAGHVASSFQSITQGEYGRRDIGKPRPEYPRHFLGMLRPIVRLLFAWSIASGVSQVLAANPTQRSLESHHQPSELSSFVQQFSASETEISLAHSGIDNFFRIEQNHRLRPKLEKMIENEELLVAIRASMDSFKKASKDIFIDPDAVVVDPVIESMHVAKLELNEAYQKLDESNNKISLTDRSIKKKSGKNYSVSGCSHRVSWSEISTQTRTRHVPVRFGFDLENL